MDAQMKTLIDRTVPRYTEIADKAFYFIVTAADTDQSMLERTIEKTLLFFRFSVFKGFLAGYMLDVDCNDISLGASDYFLMFGFFRLIC